MPSKDSGMVSVSEVRESFLSRNSSGVGDRLSSDTVRLRIAAKLVSDGDALSLSASSPGARARSASGDKMADSSCGKVRGEGDKQRTRLGTASLLNSMAWRTPSRARAYFALVSDIHKENSTRLTGKYQQRKCGEANRRMTASSASRAEGSVEPEDLNSVSMNPNSSDCISQSIQK